MVTRCYVGVMPRPSTTVLLALLLILRSAHPCFIGGSATCTIPSSTYSALSKPTITRVCSGHEDVSEASNFCLRDDIAAYAEGGVITIKPNGCPDHPYFEHDEVASTSSSCSSGGFCSSSSCSSGCSSGLCSSGCSSSPCASGGVGHLLCSSGCCSTCCSGSTTTAATTSPHTPRFHNFTMKVPETPSLSASPHLPDLDHPLGVAINGVLIIPNHYNLTHQT